MRGEDPRKIRVLDIRPPTRTDLTSGKALQVDFLIVDVADSAAVREAFMAPWPDSASDEITVFHTAANIRFYERHPALVPLSSRVNVNGVQNVLGAAQELGVSSFVFTSSGSICITRRSIWLWPWEWLKTMYPKLLVQRIDDNDALIPKKPADFFSNYAYTKSMGEFLVRSADRSGRNGKRMRTGCIRPGNGIFGPGGDVLAGAYIARRNNPSWVHHVVQHFSYVENCSLSHLCYEARLNKSQSAASGDPDIGGQAFTICDPGPPPTYGDIYTALNTLTEGQTVFPVMSPTGMLILAHVIELLYLSRFFLERSWAPFLSRLVPKVGGDLVNLQPSLNALIMPHLIFSSARASLPPSEGGLGYKPQWTTLEGLCKTVSEYEAGGRKVEERQKMGGVSFGFGLVRAQRSVGKVVDKIEKIEHAHETLLN